MPVHKITSGLCHFYTTPLSTLFSQRRAGTQKPRGPNSPVPSTPSDWSVERPNEVSVVVPNFVVGRPSPRSRHRDPNPLPPHHGSDSDLGLGSDLRAVLVLLLTHLPFRIPRHLVAAGGGWGTTCHPLPYAPHSQPSPLQNPPTTTEGSLWAGKNFSASPKSEVLGVTTHFSPVLGASESFGGGVGGWSGRGRASTY